MAYGSRRRGHEMHQDHDSQRDRDHPTDEAQHPMDLPPWDEPEQRLIVDTHDGADAERQHQKTNDEEH